MEKSKSIWTAELITLAVVALCIAWLTLVSTREAFARPDPDDRIKAANAQITVHIPAGTPVEEAVSAAGAEYSLSSNTPVMYRKIKQSVVGRMTVLDAACNIAHQVGGGSRVVAWLDPTPGIVTLEDGRDHSIPPGAIVCGPFSGGEDTDDRSERVHVDIPVGMSVVDAAFRVSEAADPRRYKGGPYAVSAGQTYYESVITSVIRGDFTPIEVSCEIAKQLPAGARVVRIDSDNLVISDGTTMEEGVATVCGPFLKTAH